MDIIIVCHTEFGYVHREQVIADKNAVNGVSQGVDNLIRIAERYGAKVTFAVCPEVAEYFPKDINHEIGLHVHAGWQEFESGGIRFYVGDRYLREHCKQSGSSSVLRDYPYEEQLNMIRTGKAYINEVLGIEAQIFVAGRWSINSDTVRALVENGFTHECSALPHAKPCHYDWSRLPRICMPYHPDKNNYQQKGDSSLLIVPTSQVFPIGQVNPELVPQVGLPWLKACFSEYYYQDIPLFHICLHSPSMTNDDFISKMDRLLEFISCHGNINFRMASEIKEYKNVITKTQIRHYLPAINRNVIREYYSSRIKRLSQIFWKN